MLPNVVVGVRPPNAQQPKNVQGNTLSRVVIGNTQIVGTRPQNPGVSAILLVIIILGIFEWRNIQFITNEN